MANPILPQNMTQPFSESLVSSRASSRATSRSSHMFELKGGLSGVDGIAIDNGNGAQCLEEIFNSVMNSAAGPSLAEETLRAARQRHPTQAS